MEQFQMTPNSQVKLVVAISSIAVVGSNVSINDKMVKKSIVYEFETVLGNSTDLKNKIITIFSNFSTHMSDSDTVANATTVEYKISDNNKKDVKKFPGTLLKVNENSFAVYLDIELI